VKEIEEKKRAEVSKDILFRFSTKVFLMSFFAFIHILEKRESRKA